MSLLATKEQEEVPAYLMDDQVNAAHVTSFMQDLLAKIKIMRKLELEAVELQAKADKAQQEFERYKSTVVVTAMSSAGVYTLRDENGLTINLKNKYRCEPNKNDADRKIIEAWLKEHGGDHLLKHQGIVPEGELSKLKEANIAFDEKLDVNTNSLKSFLLDMLGYKKGGIAKIELKDIPDCVHFTVDNDIEVTQ